MKKFLVLMLSAALLTPMFTSCKSNDDNDDLFPHDPDGGYSGLTVEEQKQKLATDATAVIEKLNGLSNASAIELLRSFAELSDNFPAFGEDDDYYYPAKSALKTAQDLTLIKDFYGAYTWNHSTKRWDESASADKLIISLPARRGGSSNNGRIEISGESSGNFIEGMEVPRNLKMILFADGNNIGSIEVTATGVSADKAPSSASMKLTLDSYSLEYSFGSSSNNMNTSLTLSKGSETLLSGNVDLTADMDALFDTEYPEEYVDKGNFELKMGNSIAFKGNVNYKSLMNTPPDNADQYIAAMNQNIKLSLVSIADNTTIASVKFIAERYEDYYETWYEPAPVLVFSDGTQATVDAFFGEGFDIVFDAWNNFIKQMQIE